MNPLVVLTAVFAAAYAAPSNYAPAGLAIAGAPLAAVAAPIAAAPAISLPAPYSTQHQEPATTSIHNPAPLVSKQVHLGQTTYVSGYATNILKPAIPDFRIAVPTALRGTQTVNAPLVKVQKEIHTVNEPFPVEKPYDVPYDVIKHVERIVEVPTPVHVAKPVPVPHPVPVQGAPIYQRTIGAPIVKHSHTKLVAQPALAAPAFAYGGYAHHGPALVPAQSH